MKRLLILIVAAAAPLLSGCHKAPEQTQAELPSATVHVQTVERKSRAATEDVVGTVRPKLSAAIESKISGRIEQMFAVPGQTVKAGERLVQLNAHEIQSRFDQAAAARQQAENDLKRAKALLEQKILSAAEFDNAQSRFQMAAAAEAEAKTMLGYTDIVAPFDGVITRKLADVGDLAAPGKALLQMENPDTLRFEADVPEALIGNVKLGDQLAVRITTVANEIGGMVAEMSPAADPNSRTYLVKLDLPGATALRSGQFGRVSVPVGEVSAIRVPASAVIQRGQLELIFVVAGSHAQLRLVKTGSHIGDEVEVVSGLNSGEQVVTEDVSALVDGQPVAVKP
ncbi:MAG: efflux RND transporter periplasmic adaptor subunit [Verrucomicrobiales bacterium]|nr:efflux RND transporter periplasmic adaptor subunit [Verrucomicrobiales bacterium]